MKNKLLLGTYAGLGIIIGAQWSEFFTRWNNLVWVAVFVLLVFTIYNKDKA